METLFSDVLATLPIAIVGLAGVLAVLIDSYRDDSPSIKWVAGGRARGRLGARRASGDGSAYGGL